MASKKAAVKAFGKKPAANTATGLKESGKANRNTALKPLQRQPVAPVTGDAKAKASKEAKPAKPARASRSNTSQGFGGGTSGKPNTLANDRVGSFGKTY